MTKRQEEDKEYKLFIMLTQAMLITGFENGTITEEQLFERGALEKLLKPFSEAKTSPENEVGIKLSIDHRDAIIRHARESIKNKENDNALIFYALYFEHEINHLVNLLLQRKKLTEKSIKQIMRLPLKDKLTWLLDLLDVAHPKESFIKFIEPFSEERNAYIHYKWIGEDIDTYKDERSLLKEAEKNITYLKIYTSRIIYSGKKERIHKRIKDLLLLNGHSAKNR